MDFPSTNLTLEIKAKLDNIDSTYDKKNEYLQRFQYDVERYLMETNIRGLLIFHSPGTGKTILAAALAEHFRINQPKRKIIILLAKSLQGNFEKNIRKYMKFNPHASNAEKNPDFIEETLKRYKFISSNASNMFAQISKIQKSESEIAYEKSLAELNEHISTKSNFLENTLIIMDEAHNIASAIKNGSKNAVKLYNTIMKTRNIKLIFLTGTPIVNTPFELVPIFNMLKGYMGKVKYTLFPENQLDFYNLFLSGAADSINGLQIKNKAVFQNRITGLLSYYGDFYFQNEVKKDFPIQLPTKVEVVNMSIFQYIRYQRMRDIENKESSYTKANTSENFAFKDPSKTSSSYRIRSRQVSNYCIPENALVFNAEKTSVQKFINRISPEDLDDLEKYSPKFQKILDNIALYPDSLSVVYSEFVSGEGLAIFAHVIERKKYIYWRDANEVGEEFDLPIQKVAKISKKLTYAVISGNVPYSEREAIIRTFNNKKNISGDYIALLLISKSGAEGLSLRNVRSIHIMEPFWNYARIEQIIARGVRFHSHTDLPENERTVQSYIYISTYPKKFTTADLEPRTTDEELLHLSMNGKKIRDQFELALIESSIDCSLNYKNLDKSIQEKITCYLCTPNNRPLYSADIRNDIKNNNCAPFEATKINAKQIKLDDSIYYYTENPVKIYEFNKDVGGYTEMKKGDKYSELLKKILF